MSQQLSLNTGMAQSKQYMVKKPTMGQDPALAAKQAEAKVAEQPAPRQQAGLRWERVESKPGQSTEFQLAFEGLTSEIGFTTVTTPQAVKAPSDLQDIRNTMQQKFVELLEQTYANSFHHNRLIAKVAEWTLGNIMDRLARLGMPAKELDKIKRRIRRRLIEENQSALNQVIYDETMLEIVG